MKTMSVQDHAGTAGGTVAATLIKRPWRRGYWLRQALLHAILVCVSVVSLTPVGWSLFASFKPLKELLTSTDLLPHIWTLENYGYILDHVNLGLAFFNSASVAVSVTVATLLTSSAVGYVFAKYNFWGKEKLFTLLLATIMVPFAVVLVPLYITVSDVGLNNKLSGIVVTGLWSTFGIFFMRQFMENIPSTLIDAGRIDGASELRIFIQVILPLSTTALSALGIFVFLTSWDNYLWPLVVLTSPSKQTLTLVIAGLKSPMYTRYDIWTAGAMVTVIPVMIFYSFASKYFIRGIAMSGLKG